MNKRTVLADDSEIQTEKSDYMRQQKTRPKRLKWKIIPSKQENHSFFQSRVLFSGDTILNLFRQQQRQKQWFRVDEAQGSRCCDFGNESCTLKSWELVGMNQG
uniref:Uncharacterized protein n=1 Tax=Oryza meridionalis TaxID=40149 RepID=A0A0E0E1P0_9ORYZ